MVQFGLIGMFIYLFGDAAAAAVGVVVVVVVAAIVPVYSRSRSSRCCYCLNFQM